MLCEIEWNKTSQATGVLTQFRGARVSPCTAALSEPGAKSGWQGVICYGQRVIQRADDLNDCILYGMRTYVRTYIHTYLPTYVRTYIHTYIHTYIQRHTSMHACTHACVRPCLRVEASKIVTGSFSVTNLEHLEKSFAQPTLTWWPCPNVQTEARNDGKSGIFYVVGNQISFQGKINIDDLEECYHSKRNSHVKKLLCQNYNLWTWIHACNLLDDPDQC